MKIPGFTFIKKNFEAIAFTTGLLLLGMMNPDTATGPGFCILEQLGVSFCPGDGLGHSISYIFRGDISNALQANVLGPFALLILGSRSIHVFYKNHVNHSKKDNYYGSDD